MKLYKGGNVLMVTDALQLLLIRFLWNYLWICAIFYPSCNFWFIPWNSYFLLRFVFCLPFPNFLNSVSHALKIGELWLSSKPLCYNTLYLDMTGVIGKYGMALTLLISFLTSFGIIMIIRKVEKLALLNITFFSRTK